MARRAPIVGATLLASYVLAAGSAAAHPVPAETPERQDVPAVAMRQALEPPLDPVPRADCGPGSRPETGIQGRVSQRDHESGRAAEGFACNTELVGSYTRPNVQGTVGGYRVERYVDVAGRECAYYDASLLFPTSVVDAEGGVNVLDMSEPSRPELTERLVSPAMLSPHESLVLSERRGLLVAVLGNPLFDAGFVDIYDVSQDCRDPVLRSSTPVGFLGHEAGMAPDGRTFYSGSAGGGTLAAVDISDPARPRTLWLGDYASHGLSISDDGNRAYVAGVIGVTGEDFGLIILDTSEIQARVPIPTVREVSRLSWESISIPQNAIPVTIDRHHYVVEIDEFGSLSEVGAGRIIDIGDERNPRVVSNLRLEVHQPENFDALREDPGTDSPIQGYAGHYCNVPQRTDPGIVACSMILSGLRVFDVRRPRRPREIAYYNAPVTERAVSEGSNYAMSSPSFVPGRGEIWYTDGFSGFHVVRVTNDVWPFCNRILGKRGADRLRGTRGDDCMRGRGGADRLSGRPGADELHGGGGRDRLLAGRGRDVVRAARGSRDRIDCGPGRDRAVVQPGKDRWRRCEKVVRRRPPKRGD